MLRGTRQCRDNHHVCSSLSLCVYVWERIRGTHTLVLPLVTHALIAGKWHLGVGEYLPYHRGFQHYYGVPYGVDMCSLANINEPCFAPNVPCTATPFAGDSSNFPGRSNDVPCPYYVNATIVEQPTSLLTIDEKCECA
jgi:hypothetical protein